MLLTTVRNTFNTQTCSTVIHASNPQASFSQTPVDRVVRRRGWWSAPSVPPTITPWCMMASTAATWERPALSSQSGSAKAWRRRSWEGFVWAVEQASVSTESSSYVTVLLLLTRVCILFVLVRSLENEAWTVASLTVCFANTHMCFQKYKRHHVLYSVLLLLDLQAHKYGWSIFTRCFTRG